MGFLGHPFPRKNRSFVCHGEVLAFFQSYANKFNLHQLIKFQTQVVNVRPLQEDRWEVIYFLLWNLNVYEHGFFCVNKDFDVVFRS